MLVSSHVRRLRDEDGGVIIAAAIIMVSVILLGAVVIQVGAWFQDRRHLQVRADAGALAGAQLFNECFVQGVTPATAETDMENWASRYAGFSSPVGAPQNVQFGTGNSSSAFQSTTYPGGGGPGADDTNTANVCDSANLGFDVKLRQDTIKGLFSFSPLASVYAHARVQLKEVQSIVPSFPLAVPEIQPSVVGVTFVNEATGAELTGCTGYDAAAGPCTFDLTDITPNDTSKLGPWTFNGAGVNLPTMAANAPPVQIGMRVGVGDVVQSCAGAGNGTTWLCFNADPANIHHGAVMIKEFPAVQASLPALQGVWPMTCSGASFVGDPSASPCAAALQAKIDFGVADPTTLGATVKATITQAGGSSAGPFSMTYDSTSGLWSLPFGSTSILVNPAVGGSEYTVDLDWQTTGVVAGNSRKSGTWTGVQRYVGATGADDGPLAVVSLSDPSAPVNAYSYVGGGVRSMNIAVLLKSAFNTLTVLRQAHLTSGTSFVSCTWKAGQPGVLDSGQSALIASMQNGCDVPYTINGSNTCPDNAADPKSPDCAQNKPCAACGNQLTNALDARFGCGNTPKTWPNAWPRWDTPGDKRAVTLITTTFDAQDNGSGLYPVTGFGAFYIAGVSGNACSDAWPAALGPAPQPNSGTIWGYFIKYANLSGVPSGRACRVNSFQNCVAVLTR
jgi:hypothetical protein